MIVTLFVDRRLSISFSFVTVVHAIMKTQIAPHGMIVSLQITAQNIINDNKFHKLHIIQTQI